MECSVCYIGGPRVELLQNCLKAMVQEEHGIFLEADGRNGYDITNSRTQFERRHYFAAGLLCGGFR